MWLLLGSRVRKLFFAVLWWQIYFQIPRTVTWWHSHATHRGQIGATQMALTGRRGRPTNLMVDIFIFIADYYLDDFSSGPPPPSNPSSSGGTPKIVLAPTVVGKRLRDWRHFADCFEFASAILWVRLNGFKFSGHLVSVGGGVFHLHRKASQAESVPSQNYNWQNWALIEAIICIQRFANFYLGAEILQKGFFW